MPCEAQISGVLSPDAKLLVVARFKPDQSSTLVIVGYDVENGTQRFEVQHHGIRVNPWRPVGLATLGNRYIAFVNVFADTLVVYDLEVEVLFLFLLHRSSSTVSFRT